MHSDLTPAERELALARLLVFKNGFLAEAAPSVCADNKLPTEKIDAAVADLLLAGALIKQEIPTGAIRYEWTSQFRGKGNEDRDLQQRKAEWFAGYLQELRPRLAGADQGIWLDQVESDHEDIAASIEWSLEDSPNPNTPLDLCLPSFRYWYVRGYLKVGAELTLEAVNRVPMRQDRNKLRALNNAALMLEATGDPQRSAIALRSALRLAQALGDAAAEASILINLATNARDLIDFPTAKTYHEDSIALVRQVGDKPKTLAAVYNYASTLLDFKYSNGVAALLDEAEALAKEIHEEWYLAYVVEGRGQLAELLGAYDEARSYYNDSLVRYNYLKDSQGVARILKALAELAVTVSRYDRAATLFGAAQVARESCSAQVPPLEHERALVAMTTTRGALGEDAFKRAYAVGHTMRMDEAVRYASANT